MKHPLHFKRVLLIALGVMTGAYALMGVLGYFYFGSEASQLITADLETKSVLSHLKIFGVIRVPFFTYCSPDMYLNTQLDTFAVVMITTCRFSRPKCHGMPVAFWLTHMKVVPKPMSLTGTPHPSKATTASLELLGQAQSPATACVFVLIHVSIAGTCMQFDRVVSGLIGVHAFTVLGPQILVLQKMLAAVCPKGTACHAQLAHRSCPNKDTDKTAE